MQQYLGAFRDDVTVHEYLDSLVQIGGLSNEDLVDKMQGYLSSIPVKSEFFITMNEAMRRLSK
jgi:hypothetical protein